MSEENGNGNGDPSLHNEVRDFGDPIPVHVHRRREDTLDDGFPSPPLTADELAPGLLLLQGEFDRFRKHVDTRFSEAAHVDARRYLALTESIAVLSSSQRVNTETDAAAARHFEALTTAARAELDALGTEARGKLATQGDLVAALARDNAATKLIAMTAAAKASRALRIRIGVGAFSVGGILAAIKLIDSAHSWLHPILQAFPTPW